ncbi:MAG: OsmC family protein [Desulfosarcinaceae bacterium]
MGTNDIQVVAKIVPGINRQITAKIRGHEVIMDVRKARGGDDTAPTPPEYLTVALGGCILSLIRLMAVEKNATLENLAVTVEGLIDPSFHPLKGIVLSMNSTDGVHCVIPC